MNDQYENYRATDPETSRMAAAQHESQAATHRELVLSFVRTFGGRTSAEIAKAVGLERHEAARRTADLRNAGLIVQGPRRTCAVNHTIAVTWLIAERRDQRNQADHVQRSLFG